MKLLWLTTTHNGLESIMNSLALWLNVSSMNQEPVVSGLKHFFKGKCEFVAYRYDEGKEAQFHYDGEVDHNILRKVREVNPSIVIYSGPAAGKCRPSLATLLALREDGRKTIGYVLDGGCPDWHPFLEEYKRENVFDVMVNTDGNPNWPQRENDVTIWQTIDPRFYEERPTKDIRVGFAGGNGSPHRREALALLQKHCGLQLAERSEAWGSYKLFSDFMLRCQITVNFPETGSGRAFHLKNRVIEAGWAGCCLLERKNPITARYFVPGVDYIEYETFDELVDIIKNLSDSEIAFRARALSLKCRELYTPEKAWEQVFSKIL